jgi:hypothetical protein
MSSRLSSLKDNLNINGGKITAKEKDQLLKFASDKFVNEEVPEILSEEMVCFTFEAVIRPMDKALVIHLKHLPPALRNPKFFDFATEFIRDRIGKFESLNASFIGELDSVNKLNSLDLMFTKYFPALMGDIEFIKSHSFKIGKQLDELLVQELGQYANKSRN